MTNGPAPIGMLPNLRAIVAVCDDWGIGLAGGMVVDNREDMRHFVACTKGHTVLMGRRTLESFPGGRPLRTRLRTPAPAEGESFTRLRAAREAMKVLVLTATVAPAGRRRRAAQWKR